ncbi:MAG: arginine--tRNA ligase [Magnetococcales bacterium]|nr:arginine--tRNA ligase [Magnetococcales bacterium]
MRRLIYDLVVQTLKRLQEAQTLPADIPLDPKIERPREKQHGDFSTNIAMVLCKKARMRPRDLAQAFVDALPEDQTVIRHCELAGPGFINFHMQEDRLRDVARTILDSGGSFGLSKMGQGQKAQVEFVSANPTGPMHVGHGRGAVLGDAIAELLNACGFQVEREYYINDAGAQVGILGQSVLLRYRALYGNPVTLPEGAYPAEYVIDIARALQNRDADKWLPASENPEKPPQEVIDFAIETVLEWIRDDLKMLGIEFDAWFSERILHSEGGIDHAVQKLEQKGLVYTGTLEPPKGKKPDEWSSRPQFLFRATEFGDETDRPLKKADGGYTYFAADIAYHLNKAERGFNSLINVWGADHGGYVKRVTAALEALTEQKGLLDVELVQMVNLTRGGKPVRMSKRQGTFVTLREVVEEVGSDAVRYWFLTRSANAMLDFDLELAVSQSNDNPVYYVQYAHARICSIWRQLKEKGLPDPGAFDFALLETPAEMDLIRMLDRYPEVVEGAALAREPHRIPHYLQELAAAFHTYYNGHRILDQELALRDARLGLTSAVRQVIANGLNLVGVQAPERM